MRRNVTLVVIVLGLAVIPVAALGETVHRPVDEMHDGCSSYAMDVKAELRAMEAEPRTLTVLSERGVAPPLTPAMRPVRLALQHAAQVTFMTIPKREGRYAGLLPFTVSMDGPYRVSVNVPVWIEVMTAEYRLEPTRFEMQTGCPILFKTIGYRIKAGLTYWLELSSNTPEVIVLLTAEGR